MVDIVEAASGRKMKGVGNNRVRDERIAIKIEENNQKKATTIHTPTQSALLNPLSHDIAVRLH